MRVTRSDRSVCVCVRVCVCVCVCARARVLAGMCRGAIRCVDGTADNLVVAGDDGKALIYSF